MRFGCEATVAPGPAIRPSRVTACLAAFLGMATALAVLPFGRGLLGAAAAILAVGLASGFGNVIMITPA